MVNLNMINKNIAFCNTILFILGLVKLLLQNKEFSKKLENLITKLIPKGTNNKYGTENNELAFSFLKFSSNNSFFQEKKEINEVKEINMYELNNNNSFIQEKKELNQKKNIQLKLKPLLFEYLKEKNGIVLDLKNKKILNYNFKNGMSNFNNQFFSLNKTVNTKTWFLSEDLIKLLNAFFKSIFCIISRPKFINTPNKIIIEILYYIAIPNNNIFKWYNFIYNTNKVIAYNYINATTLNKETNEKNIKKLSKKLNILKKQKLRVQKWNRFIKIILKKNIVVKKMLFNLNKMNITSLYYNKFTILFKLLSSYFNKPIEFNLIRLHKADYDSNILAKLFFLILKRKNIKNAIRKIYFKNKIGMIIEGKDINLVAPKKKKLAKFIPAYISGLYIHIGGRLLREKIVPKRTTKKFEKGAIATGKVNFLDTAKISKKNKKGAFTIKIAFAQNFRFDNNN
jgi:hypothetical protein